MFINDKLGIRNFDSLKIFSSTFHHPHLPTEQSSVDFFYLLFSKTFLQIILELSFHCSQCWTKFCSNSSKVITLLQPIRYFQNAIKENEDLVTAFLKHCYRFCFNQNNAIPSSFHFLLLSAIIDGFKSRIWWLLSPKSIRIASSLWRLCAFDSLMQPMGSLDIHTWYIYMPYQHTHICRFISANIWYIWYNIPTRALALYA